MIEDESFCSFVGRYDGILRFMVGVIVEWFKETGEMLGTTVIPRGITRGILLKLKIGIELGKTVRDAFGSVDDKYNGEYEGPIEAGALGTVDGEEERPVKVGEFGAFDGDSEGSFEGE